MHKHNQIAGSVGIQAFARGGSFHEIAAIEYGFDPSKLVPYATHTDLIHAMKTGEIDTAVCAVDNTVSGRVQSAIEQLGSRVLKQFHVTGLIDIPVPQVALRHPDTPEHTIVQAMSQQPALDQCRQNLTRLGYKQVPEDDTLLSALIVAENKGIVNGLPTIALASRMAGITAGLIEDGVLSDNPDSKTRFWILSNEPNWDESGDHASFVFEVKDGLGALADAVELVYKAGYDFTDIDSHLNPVTKGDQYTKKRAFFAEVRRDGKDVKQLMRDLNRFGISNRLLGIYNSPGALVVNKPNGGIPVAINHDRWRHTKGLLIPQGSQVIYISAKNARGSLRGMLHELKRANIYDMSRPVAAEDGYRGFYFVLDQDTHRATTKNIVDRLVDSGYQATELKYNNGSVEE